MIIWLGTTTLLSAAANEEVILLGATFVFHLKVENVATFPIAGTDATWDVFIAWQRGKTSGSLRTLVDTLTLKPTQ